MKIIAMAFLLFTLAWQSLPVQAALSASDFFCREIPVKPPEYFSTQVKTCADGTKPAVTNASPGICVEYGFCTAVEKELKNTKLKNTAGHEVKFSELSDKEQAKYLKDNLPPTAWLVSTLTCQKLTPSGSTECPGINNCKGDINYAGIAGTYSASDDMHYRLNSNNVQNSDVIQNGVNAK